VIALKRSNVDAWLSPAGSDLTTYCRLFDDHEAPYYEHRQAA
jgi:hypothetical protein